MEGTWREEHLFELKQAYELFQSYQQKVSECDQQIAAALQSLPNRAGAKEHASQPRQRGRKKNHFRYDATGPRFAALGVASPRIPAMNSATPLDLLPKIVVWP